ncbi:uncharacterized protein LOC107490954 [Arachis duranensis]|uniref:Uncharacterized protein LOC107490954 n=1 Tax=Arachis duranensis TaxID=130453 RepID=A0A6P4DF06_ARADU|nr:uncharacterized protein LOC107490954 [Arachis duranensis]
MGIYCYRVMPFALKNAGATYQKLLNKVFKDHKGKSVEVYVDDILVKMPVPESLVANLKPKEGKPLYLYLAVTKEALTATLVRKEGKQQQPVYFISKVLQGTKLRYTMLEKVAFHPTDFFPEAKTEYILKEVHEGCCGHHIGKKSLAHKLVRVRYYWPTMMTDASEYVKKCTKCKDNVNFHKALAEEYLIVAIDYYTKWVEAEPLASISSANCCNFLWRQVITRFGISEAAISDNGAQFFDNKFGEFLAGLGIKQ